MSSIENFTKTADSGFNLCFLLKLVIVKKKIMADSKFSQNLIKMKCSECGRVNYYTRKNKKTSEKKLELKKHCRWCRKHTVHKETKK